MAKVKILGKMYKISLVGHSQIPHSLDAPRAEIRIFREPGRKTYSLFDDERMSDVLEWTHDYLIVWIGSNDIKEDWSHHEIVNDILEIVHAIEDECETTVQVCLHEPSFYPHGVPVSQDTYAKVHQTENKHLTKRLSDRSFLHFNTASYEKNLAEDGVYWIEEGHGYVQRKLINAIEEQMDVSE